MVRATSSGAAAQGGSSVPPGLEHEMMLVDGERCVVRPIRTDDAARIVAFHERLSTRSKYLRFFSIHPELSHAEVERFTHVDYEARLALVVERDGALIAVGRYDRLDDVRIAEVAFVVADEYQHHGIATALLEDLATAARARGISTFAATTLAENTAMLGVFHHAGYPVTTTRDHDTVALRLSIARDAPPRSGGPAEAAHVEDEP